jgi:hypothetical protein
MLENTEASTILIGGDRQKTVVGDLDVTGTLTADTIKAQEVPATDSYVNNIQNGKKSNHLLLENQYGKITFGETVISDSGQSKTVSNVKVETKPPNQTGYSVLDLKGDTVNVFSDRLINLSRENGDGIPVSIAGQTTIGKSGNSSTVLTVNGIIGCGGIGCNGHIGCDQLGVTNGVACGAVTAGGNITTTGNVYCGYVYCSGVNGQSWNTLLTRIQALETYCGITPPP